MKENYKPLKYCTSCGDESAQTGTNCKFCGKVMIYEIPSPHEHKWVEQITGESEQIYACEECESIKDSDGGIIGEY